jgi:2-polyprenyl-6-methoxyphenol hydroxylase-like FAD-dependent oxidoreductase
VDQDHDVIIVGARVAGASTALLLARAGHRVVVLDRARRGSDTLSTHALMRPAVGLLERWGVLDQVIAAGTPGLDHVVFHYGPREIRLATSTTLYAPRRTVLDPLLVDAAERCGAEFRFGVEVRGLLRGGDGRIVGVQLRDGQGGASTLRAQVTIGADGRRSQVAAELRPAVTRAGVATSAFAYAYFADVDSDAYEWCYGRATTAGLIPTGDGLTAVFVGVPPDRFTAELRGQRGFLRALTATSPSVGERVAAATRVGPVRGFPGLRGWLRRPWGPGWALVGDAGYFKDPTTAHGITDALRDAQLLTTALDRTLGGATPADALGHYEHTRDQLSDPFLTITDRIASFDWTLDEVQQLHLAMSDLTQREVDELETDTDGALVACGAPPASRPRTT